MITVFRGIISLTFITFSLFEKRRLQKLIVPAIDIKRLIGLASALPLSPSLGVSYFISFLSSELTLLSWTAVEFNKSCRLIFVNFSLNALSISHDAKETAEVLLLSAGVDVTDEYTDDVLLLWAGVDIGVKFEVLLLILSWIVIDEIFEFRLLSAGVDAEVALEDLLLMACVDVTDISDIFLLKACVDLAEITEVEAIEWLLWSGDDCVEFTDNLLRTGVEVDDFVAWRSVVLREGKLTGETDRLLIPGDCCAGDLFLPWDDVIKDGKLTGALERMRTVGDIAAALEPLSLNNDALENVLLLDWGSSTPPRPLLLFESLKSILLKFTLLRYTLDRIDWLSIDLSASASSVDLSTTTTSVGGGSTRPPDNPIALAISAFDKLPNIAGT